MPLRPPAKLAKRLKSIREPRGWTQQLIAGRAGIALETYRRMEAGGKDPQWSTIIAVAAALDVSLDAHGAGR